MTNATRNERHLDAIRRQVARTRFSRRIHEFDEIVNEVFLRLFKRGELPETGTVSERAVSASIRAVLRKSRNAFRKYTDIDEIDPEEHPSYTMEEYGRGETAYRMFKEFCRSRPAPKDTVYRLCLTEPSRSIARMLGMDARAVARLADEMPDEYKNYVEKNYPEKFVV